MNAHDLSGGAKAAVARAGALAPRAGVAARYPNRKLGLSMALTDEADGYDDRAWAYVAVANMRAGDALQLAGRKMMVVSVTEKSLRLRKEDGTTTSLSIVSNKWEPFVRDLAAEIACENLQANNILRPARPLIDILKRDPAVHVDSSGSVYLRDVE